MFTSSVSIKVDDFKCDDMIEACFVVPSKCSHEILGKDKEFGIYLITQFKRIIKRCKFKNSDIKE